MMANNDNVNNTSIDSAQLIEGLAALGITITIDELQRWVKKGVIPAYTTYYKRRPKRPRGRPPKPGGKKAKEREENEREFGKEGGRPGRYSKWPPGSLIEIAAVWAVHHSGIVKRKALPHEKIHKVKEKAQSVYEYPFAYYELPRDVKLTGPNPSTSYSYDTFALKVADDDELDALVVTWIAAQEKAKRSMVISEHKRIIFHWDSIIKPSGKSGTSGQWPLGKWTFDLREIVLEDAAQDELVFLLDGMDSRKKVMYAPFIDYDPLKKYDPFESPTKLKQRIDDTLKKINESRLQPPGVDHEAAAMHAVPLQLGTYNALVGCHIVLNALVAFKEGIVDYDESELKWLYQNARVLLDALDSLELSLIANMPFVRE